MSSNSEVLSEVGNDFVVKIARIVAETACYGIYLVLMYFLILILSQQGWSLRRSAFLVVVTVLMFAGSSLFLALDATDVFERLRIILIDNPDQTLQQKLNQADAALERLTWTGEILFIFMLTLGDSVVVWRTWTLYRENRRYLIVPMSTWTGSLISALFELGCDIKTRWAIIDQSPSAGSVGAATCARSDTASFSLSFATNIICTALIMHKAWLHRKFMTEYLGTARRRTQVEKILALLIESGSAYLVLYTLQAVPIYAGTLPPTPLIAMEVVNAVIQQAMGMYPTAIVVLVQMQKSLWDTPQVSRNIFMSHNEMAFASAPGRSAVASNGPVVTGLGTTRSFGVTSHSSGDASTAYAKGRPDESNELVLQKEGKYLTEV